MCNAITGGESEFHSIPIAPAIQNCHLKKLITENPAAAAYIFQQIMDTILEELLGIKPEQNIRKTRPLQSRKKGIFGTTTAVFGVTETQGRLTLHAHCAIWGCLTPGLLQRVAHHPDIVLKVSSVIDSLRQADFRGINTNCNHFKVE